MALADDITAMRDRVLSDLNSTHDYYNDTRIAWDIVHQAINAGQSFSIKNLVTGNITTEADLAGKAPGYIAGQLAEATFQQFIAIFESFMFELLRHWLLSFPHSLSDKKVDFQAILDSPDIDAIKQSVIDKEVTDVMYGRPQRWFKYLNDRVNLNLPTTSEIEQFAEAKASRDALAHSRGIANRTYLLKANTLARFKDGDRIDIPEDYHRSTWELLRKLVADVSNAAIHKAGPP